MCEILSRPSPVEVFESLRAWTWVSEIQPGTYVKSRDGDPLATYAAQNPPVPQPPTRARYTRESLLGPRSVDHGSGLAAGAGTQTFKEPIGGQEDDEDVEGIKTRISAVKQESVNSTRNALMLARQAEETARATSQRLADQSEKLANTERHLDMAKGHSVRAADKTDELIKLNRSIFRPAITFNKDVKRAAQEAKIQARYEEERGEREKALMDVRESQNRLGRAATYAADDEEGILGGRGYKTEQQLAARKEQRKRFQFEATEEDDGMEDDIADNLDEILQVTKALKLHAGTMGQEVEAQNRRIERIDGKAAAVDHDLFRNTERLKRVGK
ncbi:hypothetical protein HWV62_16112 [Athelia sp. TMB]|nr:hypothetical protein HWV62_16112 [Athelia sp. TMB]